MVQASRLRPLAGGHRLAAENPVTVVSRGGRDERVRGRRRLQPRLPGERAARPDRARARRAGTLASGGGAGHVDRRADEPALVEAAAHDGVAAAHISAPNSWPTVAVPTPSSVVAAHVGTPSVAEAAALLSARRGRVVVPKHRSAHATCALAEVIA